MNNFKSALAVAAFAVAAITVAQSAQAQASFSSNTGPGGGVGNRTLNFSPNAAFTAAGGNDTSVTVNSSQIRTVVNVRPYIYVAGRLGGEWSVDGWGQGSKSTGPNEQYLDVYHSNPIKISTDEWKNPMSTNPGTAWGHEIPLRFTATAENATGSPIDILNANHAAVQEMNTLNNTVWSPDGPATSATLGHARLKFNFTLMPNEEAYSGTYTMNPTLTFSNQ